MKENNKVCVIGIWHLGAVYSACLSDLGYQVIGVDPDKKRVNDLNQGIPPVYEPGLKELLSTNIARGRLKYISDAGNAVKDCAYVLVAFDTPVDDNDNIDLSPVLNTCRELSLSVESETTIIINSQVPVGTCACIKSMIRHDNPALKFDVAYCPENLRLGKAIDYFKKPDRIIIGADNTSTLDKVEEFFSIISAPKLRMDLRTAEMTKHALNTFMATSISFANELANLCDEVGADALDVARALKSDSRIGPGVPVFPGLAFSGGTLARDLKILKKLGRDNHYETPLIDAVDKVNRLQNSLVIRKLNKIYGSVFGLTIGVLGLTYKAGTSTLRRSAALEIIKDLSDSGAKVKAFDPKADLGDLQSHSYFEVKSDPYTVADGADALVVLTDWPEFASLDFDSIKNIMKKPVVIDGKNLLDSRMLIQKGFIYSGVGRGKRL